MLLQPHPHTGSEAHDGLMRALSGALLARLPATLGAPIAVEPEGWGQFCPCHSPILRAVRQAHSAWSQAGPGWECSRLPAAESPSWPSSPAGRPPQLALSLLHDSDVCVSPGFLVGLLSSRPWADGASGSG